jgi:hypothetical protein
MYSRENTTNQYFHGYIHTSCSWFTPELEELSFHLGELLL